MTAGKEKTTVGAWLLHHDQKLSSAQTTEFESIVVAGRSARLLSVMSREDETTLPRERVNELARGIGIRKLEVDGSLHELQKHGLIDKSTHGDVAVLGVSQASLLHHAADIFDAQSPTGLERAAIDLAERGSQSPFRRSDCEEEVADTYRLSESELNDVFEQSEQIGFVDYESDGEERLYFNGSLFRRQAASKTKRLLENLSSDERDRLLTLGERLERQGCILADDARKLLGEPLWSKMHQMGFYDVSIVVNERGATEFVSRPEALAKYVPNGLADMLDDAKALASSLTYGIVKSSQERGKIRDPSVLIGALIGRGYVEGWAQAIKKDYKILERRGVVRVTSSGRGNRLELLKKEVGTMARDLILRGDASGAAAEIIIGNREAHFQGPENSRSIERRRQVPEAKSSLSKSLNVLRKS